MACVMLLINKLKQKRSKAQELRLKEDLLDVVIIHTAKKVIVKLVQEGAFGPDIKSVKKFWLNENNQQHASLQNWNRLLMGMAFSALVEDFRIHF